MLALARLREQPPCPTPCPPPQPQPQQPQQQPEEAEKAEEMPTTAEALVQAVGALATQSLPDDLFQELVDFVAPWWMTG